MIITDEMRELLKNLKREKIGRVAFGIRSILLERGFDGAADMAINVYLDSCEGGINGIFEMPAADAIDRVGLPVNTYPFGEPTDKIFPTLIATCNKKSRFGKALSDVRLHGLKYADNGNESVKEIVILTSVWDDSEFTRDFEEDFFFISQKCGVKILVILVTSYGAHELVYFC